MKIALRILLLVVIALQAWHAIFLTRYERAYQAGELTWNTWNAEEAIEHFERAREIDASGAEVWRRAGDLALYIHDYPDQVELEHVPEEILQRAWVGYAGAVMRRPVDSWSWAGLAEVALNRAERMEARRGLDLAQLERQRRGILDRDRAVAMTAARLAVWLKPAGFQELDVLASIYESVGDIEEAERIYQESARMMPVASYHVWGTGKRLPPQLYRAILRGLEAGVEHAPRFERSILHAEVAHFARKHGDYEAAIAHGQKADQEARTSNESYRANWELAQAYGQVGRLDDAIEATKKARESAPDRTSMSHFLGNLEMRGGQMEAACADLRDAVRREPGNAGVRILAARACEQAGESELAVQVLRDGIVVPDENLTLARALIDLHVRQGRRRTAKRLLEVWARDYPGREEFSLWSDQIGDRER